MPQPMPPAMDPAMGAEAPPMEAPAPAPESDVLYEICLDVLKDGTFRVYKEASDGEEESEAAPVGGEDMMAEGGVEEGEIFDSFEDALRGAVQIYRENPIDETPSAQMKAGYGAEEGY